MSHTQKELYSNYPQEIRGHGDIAARMSYRLEQTNKYISDGKCESKLIKLGILKRDT